MKTTMLSIMMALTSTMLFANSNNTLIKETSNVVKMIKAAKDTKSAKIAKLTNKVKATKDIKVKKVKKALKNININTATVEELR